MNLLDPTHLDKLVKEHGKAYVRGLYDRVVRARQCLENIPEDPMVLQMCLDELTELFDILKVPPDAMYIDQPKGTA